MSIPQFDVLTGMAEWFLSQSGVRAKIQQRLYDTLAPEWIVALENTTAERSPRTGPFVEYEDVAGGAAQNLSAESDFNRLRVTFRCYGFQTSEARGVLTAFYDCFTGNRLTNQTWGGRAMKLANWDLESRSVLYDETVRMAVLSCDLDMRFAS